MYYSYMGTCACLNCLAEPFIFVNSIMRLQHFFFLWREMNSKNEWWFFTVLKWSWWFVTRRMSLSMLFHSALDWNWILPAAAADRMVTLQCCFSREASPWPGLGAWNCHLLGFSQLEQMKCYTNVGGWEGLGSSMDSRVPYHISRKPYFHLFPVFPYDLG